MQRMLMRRARRWVKRNNCPLPLDLAFEFMEAGLDPQTIEDGLLFPNEPYNEDL